jgi:hypothetical protein
VSLLRYVTIVGGVALVSGAAVMTLASAPARPAVGLGLALATLNTIVAFALASWAEHRPVEAFFRAILGGMLARMVLMLGVVAWAVLGLGLPSVPLALALLGYFVAFLIFELAVLHRGMGARPMTP